MGRSKEAVKIHSFSPTSFVDEPLGRLIEEAFKSSADEKSFCQQRNTHFAYKVTLKHSDEGRSEVTERVLCVSKKAKLI